MRPPNPSLVHRKLRGCLAVLPLAGCASTVLIPPNDPTFDRAQRRLESTATRVEALGPPSSERALFMQAEAFYQYRYAPPSRGGLAYLGELGAALTDFPALQSF